MVDPTFFFNIIVIAITAITLAFSIKIFTINYKPSLAIDKPHVRFTSKKNARIYSPELMYVTGNPACSERNTINTMHVRFSIHNTSQFTLHNIAMKYIYSNKKITEGDFIKQKADPRFSLAPNRNKTITKNHEIDFDGYDNKSHYFAILICVSHHLSKSQIFATLYVNKNHDDEWDECYK